MTTAFGLKTRVPFLDQDLVDLAAACPPELKTAQAPRGTLKDLGRKVLPAQMVDRPKGHFPVPTLIHLEEPIVSMVREALYAPEAKDRDGTAPIFWRSYWKHPPPGATLLALTCCGSWRCAAAPRRRMNIGGARNLPQDGTTF